MVKSAWNCWFCQWHQLLPFTCHFLPNAKQILAKCLPMLVKARQTLARYLPNACQILASNAYLFTLLALCFASCLPNSCQILAKWLLKLAKHLPNSCQMLAKRFPNTCQMLNNACKTLAKCLPKNGCPLLRLFSAIPWPILALNLNCSRILYPLPAKYLSNDACQVSPYLPS